MCIHVIRWNSTVTTIPAKLISKFKLVVTATLMINIALFSSSSAPEFVNCNINYKQFSPTHKQFSPTPNFSCIHTNHNSTLNK